MIDAALVIPVYRSSDGELHIVMILRQLVETRTTGYRVFPYLARIQVPNRWQLAERVIAEIIDVKLSELMQPDAHAKRIEHFSTWQRPQQVSSYQVGSHRLWGLSYRILHPVIPRLMEGEWDV
jgi:hypothetical protein